MARLKARESLFALKTGLHETVHNLVKQFQAEKLEDSSTAIFLIVTTHHDQKQFSAFLHVDEGGNKNGNLAFSPRALDIWTKFAGDMFCTKCNSISVVVAKQSQVQECISWRVGQLRCVVSQF